MVRHMPNKTERLNQVFQALSDPTRRAVLRRLSRGPVPTLELARPFGMALPSFTQHLRMLEEFGLVKSRKSGRVRTYALAPHQLRAAESWMTDQRKLWECRLDQLDAYLLTMKENGDDNEE
jgi:DNA-binding transcriptional ArsR family regulator